MKYIVPSWETWETTDKIASRFGVTAERLMTANPALYSIPAYPGMMLEIPDYPETDLPGEGCIEYVIQPDDSISSIANRFKLDYGSIVAQNPQITNPNVLWPGQIIYLIYS